MKLIDADAYKTKLYKMMPKFDEENDKSCIEGQTIYFCAKMLDNMPAITPLPDTPLTKDELINLLRGLPEVKGEPVFYMGEHGERTWHLLRKIGSYAGHTFVFWEDNKMDLMDDYGKKWWAYLRVPDGVAT